MADIEFIVTDTEAEALALEANLIKQHQPHFNVLLKDDKKYPYVCITWSEPYPRIFITRKRQFGNAGSSTSDSPKDRYYGPYVDSFRLRQTLALVKRLFHCGNVPVRSLRIDLASTTTLAAAQGSAKASFPRRSIGKRSTKWR